MSSTAALYHSGPQCQAVFRLCADNGDNLRLEATDVSDATENVVVNDTLAVRLLISRRDLKFNQEDVADRAGVSRRRRWRIGGCEPAVTEPRRASRTVTVSIDIDAFW